MELAPFGKAAETGLRRRRAGLGKMPKFFFRSLQSESSSSRELFLGSAWISPDGRCEKTCHSPRMKATRGARLKGMKRVGAMTQFEIQGCVQNCTDSKSGQNHNIAMLSGELIETPALKVPCPTCRVGRGVRCERAIGGVRRQSHLDRRLIASDKVKRKLNPPCRSRVASVGRAIHQGNLFLNAPNVI